MSPAALSLALFETVVLVDDLDDGASLAADLHSIIVAHRTSAEGVRVSNLGGWQSSGDMLGWGGAPADRLARIVESLADRHSVDVAAKGGRRHRWSASMWANVSPAGAVNQVHAHPGSFWSAVFYVDDGAGVAPVDDLSGELLLIDPRMPMTMMTMPNLRIRGSNGQVYEPQVGLPPKAGRLVMFPSWLNHCVQPHRGKGDRISVAINLMAVPLAAGSA